MTIDLSDNNPRINYAVAQGVTQTVFSVPFEFFDDADVTVYVDGVLKAEGTDYTLTGGDGSTGTLTFVTATPPEVQQVTGASGGSTVTLVRHIALERTTDFVAGQDINRAALNEELDTIVGLIADLDDRVDRTIHLSDSEVAPSMLLTEDRKGRVLAFDATTGNVEAGPLSSDIAIIADNIAEILAADDEATAAAASAAAASSSASSASTSAFASATSASNSASSASAAASSASAASASESNAATSETNAATSETNAATSATNAATSETNAAASASSAQASKDAALAALDSFDDRYLGQKASDPTLDNDGDALVAGALYFNTTDDVMKVYEGSVWVAAYASLSGALLAANNLSDLNSASTARTNLGLGTAATTASTDYATAAQGTLADSAVQPNDSPTFAGLTTTANVSFGDNDKAIFGAGNDLQIFALSGNSYISEGGAGSLSIRAADLLLRSPTDENYVVASNNGAVTLYYDNAAKLATTSTGINVTGTVTADGLTVDGDTLYVDASNNRVGIGTDSLAPAKLTVSGGDSGTTGVNSGYNELYIQNSGNAGITFSTPNTARAGVAWADPESNAVAYEYYDHANGGKTGVYESYAAWITSGSERMRINSSGNVGIGTSSPATALDVNGTVTATAFVGDGSSLTGIDAGATGGGSDKIFWENGQTVTTNYTITDGQNAMSAGPITINSGVTVTVGAGETWTVV